jgi:hypothetical protein
MASAAVKAIQGKLFRGGDESNNPTPNDDPRDPPGLTIHIPRPVVTPKPEPPPKSSKSSPRGATGTDDAVPNNYRQRLANKLGADYQGAERYRLKQDEARQRHWKRWGPYLSDRQWVGTICRQVSCSFPHIPWASTGNGP